MIEMTNADEFYQYAKECLRDAEKAETDQDWSVFIHLSVDWMLAAARLGGGSVNERRDVTTALRRRICTVRFSGD